MYASWSGDKKSDIKSWSKYPMISSFSGGGFSITNLNNVDLSTINGNPIGPDTTSRWATFRAIQTVDLSNNAIIRCSTINGSVFPQVIPPVSNWATFRAIQTVDLSNNAIIRCSTINGSVFPQVIPPVSNWATFRAIQTVDLSNNSIIRCSTINGSVFPQIIPADRAPLWATFNAVQTVDISNNGLINVSSINGSPFISVSNWASFPASQNVNLNNLNIEQVALINGSPFPQVIPADNTSNWATFPARANLNMSNFSIVNLNQINGSNYPPTIPVQNPDRWSQYPAILNVNMANFSLNNAFNGQFTNNLIVGGNIFRTEINNGDITCDNLTVGNTFTGQADVNIFGVNLAPSDNALYVSGGTTLDGGGAIHGITIGTLPAGGINTQRLDVLPTGITVTTPTLFTVLGLGAISLNVAGAGNFAVGGPLSLASGAFIEQNASNVRMINTSSGNQNTLLNVGRVDGPFDLGDQFPLVVGNSGSAGTHLENITRINNQPYPPPSPPQPPPPFQIQTQTMKEVLPIGLTPGDASQFINQYFKRNLNAGEPALVNDIFPTSTTIPNFYLQGNGQMSIPPGTYLIDVFCPVVQVGQHGCRIFDIDNQVVLALGNNGFAGQSVFSGQGSTLSSVISISVTTTIEVQQRITNEANNPIDSLGMAMVFQDEVYTTARFTRVGPPTLSSIPESSNRTWTGYMSTFYDLLPDTENAVLQNLSISNVFMGPTPQIPGRQSAIAYPLEVLGQWICIVNDGGWEKSVIMEIEKAEGVGLIFRATTTHFRQQNSFPQWSLTERSLNQSIIPSMNDGGPPSDGPNQTGYAITGFTVSF